MGRVSLKLSEGQPCLPPAPTALKTVLGVPGCRLLSSHCNIKVSMGQTLALFPRASSTGMRDQQSVGVSRMGNELPGAAALVRNGCQ